MRNVLVTVSVLAILLALALTFITARFVDQERIAEVELERERLRGQRDSLQAVNALRDSLQQTYQHTITRLQTETQDLRAQVAALEAERVEQQLSVRSLRRPADLQQRFVDTFPEVAGSDWGVTEVMNEETGLGIQYLLVPLWFSETFIIDHQNAASFEQQRDVLLDVDSLQQVIIAYKDSVLVLEQAKAAAWNEGYTAAYTAYDSLSREHIELLKQPPVVRVFPGKTGMAISGSIGALLGLAAGQAIK